VLEGTAAPRAPAHRGAVLTVIEPPPKWIVDCLRAWNAGDTAEADVLAELTPTDPYARNGNRLRDASNV
jgi:hypothetical protein